MLATIAVVVTASAELSDVETKYLKQFANYTGGMGIGFVPEHTYDYGFRQAVLKTKDEELQRAFILQKLPFRISSILNDLKRNQKMIGKAQYRDLKPDERAKLVQSFGECMSLLRKLDAKKNEHFYKEYREAFDAIEKQRR
jgi:hypothetical protein